MASPLLGRIKTLLRKPQPAPAPPPAPEPAPRPAPPATPARPAFDEKQYWIERHEKLRGDVRSVGNVGYSLEENQAGQQRLRERLGLVLDHLGPDGSGKTILDFGCGIGLLAPLLTGRGLDYLGVDVSPAAIDQARQRCPAASFEVADIVQFRSTRRFDLIVASYVLVHLVRDEDWARALTSVADLLRDDGRFILIDEVPDGAPARTAEHVVTRTVATYREALPRFGLRLVDAWLAGDRARLGGDALRHFFLIERADTRR